MHNNKSNMWIMLVSILVCAVLLAVLLFTANSAQDPVRIESSTDAAGKTSSSQVKKIDSIVALKTVSRKNGESSINLPLKKTIKVVNPVGGNISNKAQEAQLRDEDSSRVTNQYHDDVHPSRYPQEWDTISNKYKICWIHKKTHKKVCESRI